MFESEKDVLDWYESQPRSIDSTFQRSIPWDEVRRHPLNPRLAPILLYMRDVESFTDQYYRELLRTPTGKDPVIRRFMDRWGAEEADHGQLLNRFLSEAGVPASRRWRADVRASVSLRYRLESYISTYVTNLFGTHFTGTHMVWGAINELATLHGYRRLWQLAGHPVLERILRAIAQEESAHAHFYLSVARLRLERSKLSRRVARFFVERFWAPVGQGLKSRKETDYVVGTLFRGQAGIDIADRYINQRIARLPGFAGLRTITERVAAVAH